MKLCLKFTTQLPSNFSRKLTYSLQGHRQINYKGHRRLTRAYAQFLERTWTALKGHHGIKATERGSRDIRYKMENKVTLLHKPAYKRFTWVHGLSPVYVSSGPRNLASHLTLILQRVAHSFDHLNIEPRRLSGDTITVNANCAWPNKIPSATRIHISLLCNYLVNYI